MPTMKASEGTTEVTTPSVSADGRFVAFESFANNLVSGELNGSSDVFVRDRGAGVTERISVSTGGFREVARVTPRT